MSTPTPASPLPEHESIPAPARPPLMFRRAACVALAGALMLLLIDVAVETFLAHSRVRWIVGATVAAYVVATIVALLRRKLSAGTSAFTSATALLGLLCLSAWWPGEMSCSVVMLRQTTWTLMAAVTALGVLLAGWIVGRTMSLPRLVRIAAGLATVYGAVAICASVIAGTPYPELFHGRSLWRPLPFWLQGAVVGALVVVPVAIILSVIAAGMRAPRSMTRVRQAIVLGLTFLLSLSGFRGGPASGELMRPPLVTTRQTAAGDATAVIPPAPEGLQQALERLNRYSAAVDDIRSRFRASEFDVVSLAGELGDDPAKLFAFVRDETRGDVYWGVLRGANGTLMNRAGNSADRSLLLAELLRRHGRNVRVAHGELPDAAAMQLVSRLLEIPPRQQQLPESVESANGFGSFRPSVEETRFIDAARDRARRIAADIERRSADDAQFIAATVQRTGVELHDDGQAAGLLAAAKDHYWLQVEREGQWLDYDPSFRDARPEQRFTDPTDTFAPDQIPGELMHRITFRVLIEQLSAEGTTVTEALTVTRPSHELVGQGIVFTNAALDVVDYSGLPKANKFAPLLLIGEGEQRGSEFVVSAQTEQPPEAMSELAGSPSEPATSVALTAEWLTIEVDSPRGERRAYTRQIVDRIGTERRASHVMPKASELGGSELVSLALLGRRNILIGSALYNASFLVHRTADVFVRNQELIAAATKAKYLTEAGAAPPTPYVYPAELLQLFGFYSLFLSDQEARLGGAARAYIARPLVLTFKQTVSREPRSTEGRIVLVAGFDILEPGLEIVARDPSRRLSVLFKSGTTLTNLERAMVNGIDPARCGCARRVLNASTTFELAAQHRVPTVALTPSDVARVDALDLPQSAKMHIREDLARGFTVITPQRIVDIDGTPASGWWRIKSSEGAVLGIGEDGEGQAISEYRIVVRLVAFGTCGLTVAAKMTGNFSGKAPSEQRWNIAALTFCALGWFAATTAIAVPSAAAVSDTILFLSNALALATALLG